MLIILSAGFHRVTTGSAERVGGVVIVLEKRSAGTTGANADLVASGNNLTATVKGILAETWVWDCSLEALLSS